MIPFKKYYLIFLETGIIITLLLFIIAVKIDFTVNSRQLDLSMEQEATQIEDIIQTEQPEKPPTVPRPVVPVAVPNDEIIADEILNLDAELNLNDALDVPAPPPSGNTEESGGNGENFFIVVEQMPELIGGLASVQEKIVYPAMARKAGIEGRVIVQFIVNKSGQVENPVVIRSIGGGCDEEALRVVKKLNFRPGRQRGEPVRVQFSLPFVFKLHES